MTSLRYRQVVGVKISAYMIFKLALKTKTPYKNTTFTDIVQDYLDSWKKSLDDNERDDSEYLREDTAINDVIRILNLDLMDEYEIEDKHEVEKEHEKRNLSDIEYNNEIKVLSGIVKEIIIYNFIRLNLPNNLKVYHFYSNNGSKYNTIVGLELECLIQNEMMINDIDNFTTKVRDLKKIVETTLEDIKWTPKKKDGQYEHVKLYSTQKNCGCSLCMY